ncbi:ROK family protein [Sedimentisphaera salicampi]|uniref:Fructokinase n=1 Tax=Sedimentisphaera salicampi TaxID=1941349 RepID=A0A1W6LKH4_9BACT|nr:ROK family protein [Sedimentisphaera salicampi]ARN56243.1 Fructokinase [Sedimentisphaera salicampi]
MNPTNDNRIVLTLDAGGTNFVFSAMQDMKEIVEPVKLPAFAEDLDKSLGSMVKGFSEVIEKLPQKPAAISFAFPGPADYPNGIIDNVGNLPAYAGGIPLGSYLEEKFQIPVYINNDGDLFVYGEAIAGFLPKVNSMLEKAGSPTRFKNLFGITIGTGFGAGIVSNGELFIGDNSAAGEIWITRNSKYPECFAEEGVSIRAVKNKYAELAGISQENAPEPKDIYEIANGTQEGNKQAALDSFAELGEIVGDSLANAITLIDGIIVIGGGLSAAYDMFIDAALKQMNGTISSYAGEPQPRIVQTTIDLESEEGRKEFIEGKVKQLKIPGSDKEIPYDAMKRIGIGKAVLDTSQAVSIGAYAYALSQLDK